MNDIYYMKRALELAEEAFDKGEIPVGAVVVRSGEIVGEGYNLRESKKNALLHAEVIAIEKACAAVGGWRLSDCTLYVTLEPCPMCAGAMINSRIKRVVFGAKDAAAGCCGSLINFNSYPFNHAFEIQSGLCADESAELLRRFFNKKRESGK